MGDMYYIGVNLMSISFVGWFDQCASVAATTVATKQLAFLLEWLP
jgi:hypothetical protein